MKFYQRPEFMELNQRWRKKLAKQGSKFHDIEDERENLYQPDLRTQSFEDREQILDFFLSLDAYLLSAELPKKHRKVLELYSAGKYLTDISIAVRMSYSWVKLVIARYEKIVLKK